MLKFDDNELMIELKELGCLPHMFWWQVLCAEISVKGIEAAEVI